MTKLMFIRRIIYAVAASLLFMQSNGQDLHYADVQSMNLWYNQSLKLNKQKDIRYNFRDIKYQSLLAFRNSSIMVNIPFVRKDGEGFDKKSFLSATAAGSFDKSSKGVFKNNTGMLGLSFAQRLSSNDLYLSIGFQGAHTNTRLGEMGGRFFPDQFDQYGPVPSVSRDPLRVGRSYGWTSINTGLSIFQNTSTVEWYAGAGIRHLNRPFTDEQKTNDFRLRQTLGVQAGFTVKNELNQFGVYGITNWKAEASEYLIGAKVQHSLDQPSKGYEGSAIGIGFAFRVRDAVIPNLQLKLNRTTIAIHYDVNISGLSAAGYSRQGVELMIAQKLN
jgi:hypothetical protein